MSALSQPIWYFDGVYFENLMICCSTLRHCGTWALLQLNETHVMSHMQHMQGAWTCFVLLPSVAPRSHLLAMSCICLATYTLHCQQSPIRRLICKGAKQAGDRLHRSSLSSKPDCAAEDCPNCCHAYSLVMYIYTYVHIYIYVYKLI